MPAAASPLGVAFTPGNGPIGLLRFDFRPLTPAPNKTLSGVTRDISGVPLPSCVVKLFRVSDDRLVDQVTSDAGGNYLFGNCSPAETYYIVAYLPGAPDVAGTTVNTLSGI